MANVKYQKGHAAMLFAMVIPVLFGVFTLGSDGTRALQSKARLNESIEVAALAVAAQSSEHSEIQKQTAASYISYFFPGVTVDSGDISVDKITCDEYNSSCNYDSSTSRYFQYTVSGTISVISWFPGNSATIGFGDSYQVASSSVARKYQSETIDIVYVADFSGSMGKKLKSATGADKDKPKYVILREIIGEVNADVKDFNDKISLVSDSQSKVGFTAFNRYVHGTNGSGAPCNITNWKYNNWLVGDSNVDVSATVNAENIFGEVDCFTNSGVEGTFGDIELTENFGTSSSSFESTLNGFNPQGYTSSTQGIIQGAKIAYTGVNPRKLIIILSDGEDKPSSVANVTNNLVASDLCDNIRDVLDSQVAADGKSVKSRIALIGFDYNVLTTNEGLTDCVGGVTSSNIYQANSSGSLKTAILSLISEEIGRLANDKKKANNYEN